MAEEEPYRATMGRALAPYLPFQCLLVCLCAVPLLGGLWPALLLWELLCGGPVGSKGDGGTDRSPQPPLDKSRAARLDSHCARDLFDPQCLLAFPSQIGRSP